MSLLQQDGFVISEAVIGIQFLGESKSSGFPPLREWWQNQPMVDCTKEVL